MAGILGVWNDRAGNDEAEYEAWYQEEHVPQRLAFAGFRQARRYIAVFADRRYFTWYSLDDVAVLQAPDYLACLAEPTPRTQAVMPSFRGMIRAELTVSASLGCGVGGMAVCLRLDTGSNDPEKVIKWTAQKGVVSAQSWTSPQGSTPLMSSETRFRGAPDGTASSVLLIECLHEQDALRIAAALAADTIPTSSNIGVYRLLCCTDAAATGGGRSSDSRSSG